MVHTFIDVVLHLDKYLGGILEAYGTATYAVLFVVIFLETGLVVTPFLPGDSLIFAAGTFAAIGSLNLAVLLVAISMAAILGDTANYHIGKQVGNRVYSSANLRLIKKKHVLEAREFYSRYGPIAIVISRFIPIIRTFVPFVAGIGEMSYPRFLEFNAVGGITWVSLFLLLGYFFGRLPIVKNHFSLVTLAIIVISVIPAIVTFIRGRQSQQ